MPLSNALGVLASIAPTIATALGTPILGGAVAALESVFGLTPGKSSMQERQDALAAAISGATPEQLAAVRKADQDYAARMAEAGFKSKEALAALAVQEQTLYVQDTANAREANARNDKVFWLGVVILATFALVMFASLWGAYALLTGRVVVENAALVGMVAGFVGTVIGYVSANAQQVVGFFYGSSKGSEAKTDAMAAAFTQTFGVAQSPPEH
ncbi:hypothetical protein PPMP20_19060 [Paraburkholderia phymatum]|uniref:Transmembrane protein n=1 Tax=Paraburkholderia phymatum (strain DSM 17167 / CIP 108236 / LMG 21445 / STM815) TaxID=391038 RepID=B2JUJ4_PARP8|nr:hypothetical protein [Paraburkholderia phymatum]ACC76165.1 hypothetical protein Bphy_7164 [Paraburkholderia phymatum STM815]